MIDPLRRSRLRLAVLAGAFTIVACTCSLLGGGEVTPTLAPATESPATAPPPTRPPATQPPPTEPEELPSPTSPASIVAGDLQISSVHGYRDTLDSLKIVGLVTNQTERAVDSIEVEVEVFDASGTSLLKETTFSHLSNLAPGETTPFSLSVFEDLPDADNFEATIVGSGSAEVERAPVEVRKIVMTKDDDGDLHITGEIFNGGDQPVVVNSLAAATFDASGELVTAESSSVSIEYLDAGEDGPFRVLMIGPASGVEDVTDFEVYLDAIFADPTEVLPITFSDNQYNYFDASGRFHLVGELTNSGAEAINPRLVAAIFDAAGDVIDAASLDTALTSLAPGETVPYDFDFWGPLNYTGSLFDSADSYSVQIDPYWSWTTDVELLDLTTAGDSNTFDETQGTFTGQVVNNSGGPIAGAKVIVVLHDKATGAAVAMGYTSLSDEMADGAAADYTVYVPIESGFDVNSAEFTLIVKGEHP